MGRCAARPAVRGGAPSLSSVAELVGGCVTTGGSRQQSSGEPTHMSNQLARIWRTFVASILRMSWHQLKACVPHRRIRARYSDFGYLLVWGYIADLSMVPRLRRGRLAGRALRTPFYLARSKPESLVCRCLEGVFGCKATHTFLYLDILFFIVRGS